MNIEVRVRGTNVNGLALTHHDLLFIPDSKKESALLDLLGQPGSYVQGQIRLADGYGEHYMLIQPRFTRYPGPAQATREFPESEELLAMQDHRVTVVPNPPRAATPGRRKKDKGTK